ncbi:hypothetical protein [Kitasatospora kifunensis]|uniref:Uncharacterized protein n=1 Tax=Kitasatospora kifunensis TaxID=58351 RepID=A0A7W7VUA0_KITKI|nr:hypothetical protein [Kitasatospora kifunensis]MBB4922260.1 hypothetical protein [Kitasatospora kifunensis]
MALRNVANWELAVGSQSSLQFVFTQPSGALYNITGLSWEFRVRTDPTDTSTAPLIEITQTGNAQGLITANTSASTVLLTLNPAATQTMAAATYAWALWSNPGTTTATQWVGGSFRLDPVVQP